MKLSQWLNKKGRAEENRMIDIVRKSEWFDERWYVSQYPDVFKKLKDPARHYCFKGWMENRNPSKNFSTSAYLNRYPECNICPLVFEHNRNDYVDLSICAIMKNEAPYVQEWIDYHRLVGVKRFYIYDNESTDNLKEVLTPYIEQGVVIYKYYPGLKSDGVQTKAYNECVANYKDKTEWLAIIDADEFIVPMEKKNIPDFLEDYKDYPGVGINWICYDSNEHKTKPKGGLLENYTRCYFDEQYLKNHHIKSIVRPIKIKNINNPHYCFYINDERAVTENYEKIDESNGKKDSLAFTEKVSVSKIRINHYWCKSEEEYLQKIKKPRISGIFLKENKDEYIFKDYKYDYSVFRFLCRMKPHLVLKETLTYIILCLKNVIILCVRPYNSDSTDYYFDKKWYTRKYLKRKSDTDPVEHYNRIGWKQGYNPSRNFDTNFYLNTYPDIVKAGINPLIHYLKNGKKEGRLPKAPEESLWKKIFANKKLLGKSEEYVAIYKSGLFDEKWYLAQYPNIKKQGIDALSHYLDEGWKLGYNPSEKFDTKFYLQNCPDVEQAGVNPLRHYIISGKNEGRNCMPFYRKITDNGSTPEKDKNPKISVIVASFNYEQYIGETLDSLVKQTYKNFEVIVVDDGSKDNSVNIIKKYTKKYPNVFLHRHHQGTNRGLFETIKLGLEKSTGKYIAFCESDDYWLPNNLEEKIKVINEYNSPKIIYNNVKLFGPGQKKQEEYIANLSLVGEGLYEVDPINQTYNIIPTFSCVMIDKQALLECDFNSYIPAWTDWWLYRQIFAKYPMYHVNKALTMWRIHDSYNSEKKAEARMEHFDEFIFYNNELVVDRNKKLVDKVYEDNHVKLLLQSDLFDEKYYLKHYPEVKKFKLPPVYHYLKVGWKLGYNPSEKFNTNAYLNLYTDVTKLNPLVHYLLFGKKENRNPIACNQEPVFYDGNSKNNCKNILLVSNLLNHTGAPMLLLNISELFINKGYKVTILSPFDGDLRDEFLKIGADVIIDARIYGNDGHEEYLKKYNFSYCVCNTFINSVIYNMVSKFIPSVLWCHENINNALSGTITERLEKINEIYVPSLLTKSYMDKFNSNVKILPYPIKDIVNNISFRTDKGALKIAVCATLSARKGQDIFVEAIKNINEDLRKDVEFIMLGDAGTAGFENKIKKMAQNITNVKFLPALKNLQEYHKFLDSIDVLCCPSREDPSPLVVIDAFMHGIPVIISDHVGQSSLITNGVNGFIFTSENVEQLKEIMEKIIRMGNLEDLRKKSRTIFEENFDQDKFYENFSEIMEAKCTA